MKTFILGFTLLMSLGAFANEDFTSEIVEEERMAMIEFSEANIPLKILVAVEKQNSLDELNEDRLRRNSLFSDI